MPGARVVAILLIFMGGLALLRNIGFHVPGPITVIRTGWPLLLSIWGFRSLARIRSNRRLGRYVSTMQEFFAIVFAAIGIVLTGQNLGLFNLRIGSAWGIVWPLCLIYLGFSALSGTYQNLTVEVNDSMGGKEKNRRQVNFGPVTKSLIGDIELGKTPFELTDLRSAFVFGEVQIDLSNAIVPDREVTLDISGNFGSITLLVPKDLPIAVHAWVHWVGDLEVLGQVSTGINRALHWSSPGYTQSEKKVRVFLEMKMGEINVRYI